MLAVIGLAVAVGLLFLTSDPIETHDTPGRVPVTDPIAGSLVHSVGAGGSTLATAGLGTGAAGLAGLPANLAVPANPGTEQTAAVAQDKADTH
ncbi:MAG TPA: hypothetical protein VHN79_10745 [Lacunisphaera sp.]|nr:hypothetical protein [Lacunisphaera sp.]